MRVQVPRRAPSRSSHAAASPSRSSHLVMAETPLAESRMPLRLAAYVAAMSVVFPSTLAISAGRAVYQRVAKGTPDAILPTGRINPIAQGGGYARAVEPPGLHRVHFFVLRSAPAAASIPQPPSAWLERARAFRLIGPRDD